VAITEDGTHWFVETKGCEDVEVKLKDGAAINWCDSASRLTKQSRQYLKVPQKGFLKSYIRIRLRSWWRELDFPNKWPNRRVSLSGALLISLYL